MDLIFMIIHGGGDPGRLLILVCCLVFMAMEFTSIFDKTSRLHIEDLNHVREVFSWQFLRNYVRLSALIVLIVLTLFAPKYTENSKEATLPSIPVELFQYREEAIWKCISSSLPRTNLEDRAKECTKHYNHL